MHLKYLVTGSEESLLLFEELKKRGYVTGDPLSLDDYFPREGDLPILIGGSGREHERTHDLSVKISELYGGCDLVKVLYDQHQDSCASPKLSAGTHIYHTKQAGIFSDIVTVQDLRRKPQDESDSLYNLGFKTPLDFLEELNRKKIHVTIDLDILDEDYIDSIWLKGKSQFKDLYDSLVDLAAKNEIIAVDVCGTAPFNCLGSTCKYRLSRDGYWVQFSGPGLTKERLVAANEPKEIAPTFYRSVIHYGEIIGIFKETA